MIGSHFRRASADRPDPDPGRATQARALEALFRARIGSCGGGAYRLLRSRADAEEHHPIELGDAQRAMRLVRARARQWNLGLDRIGIMGFSAQPAVTDLMQHH